MNQLDLRRKVADFAIALDGLAADGPKRDAYLDFLSGGLEAASGREGMAHMSSCALTVRAIWRELGCRDSVLLRRYVIGRAMADVVAIGQRAGAWRTGSDGDTPGVGDAVIVGDDPKLHAYTVVAGHGDGTTWQLETIDGGQGPGGCRIVRKTRVMAPDASGRLIDTLPDGYRRRVFGWVDCVALLGPVLGCS